MTKEQDQKIKDGGEWHGRLNEMTTIGAERKVMEFLTNELVIAAKKDIVEESAARRKNKENVKTLNRLYKEKIFYDKKSKQVNANKGMVIKIDGTDVNEILKRKNNEITELESNLEKAGFKRSTKHLEEFLTKVKNTVGKAEANKLRDKLTNNNPPPPYYTQIKEDIRRNRALGVGRTFGEAMRKGISRVLENVANTIFLYPLWRSDDLHGQTEKESMGIGNRRDVLKKDLRSALGESNKIKGLALENNWISRGFSKKASEFKKEFNEKKGATR